MKKVINNETKSIDSERAFGQHFIQKLKELGIDGKYIRQEYPVWTGNGVQYKVDIAVMDDNDIPYGLFEVRFIRGNDEEKVAECISKMESVTENVVPCFSVICQKGGKPLLYQLNDSGGRVCYDLDIELPHVCTRINPTENSIKSVGDYLAAIKRAKAALNIRQGKKGLFSRNGKGSEVGQFYFRGQDRHYDKLTPSLYRTISENGREANYFSEEEFLLDEAQRLFPGFFARNSTTDLEKMSIAQHYEVPTRLLDVTGNALVALYFAAQGDDKEDGEVFVFRNSVDDVHNALSCRRMDALKMADYHSRSCLSARHKPFLVLPPFVSERQKAQDGGFYVFGGNPRTGHPILFAEDEYVRLRIPKGSKDWLLNELEDFCNVHKATLFPESLADSKDKIIREARRRMGFDRTSGNRSRYSRCMK